MIVLFFFLNLLNFISHSFVCVEIMISVMYQSSYLRYCFKCSLAQLYFHLDHVRFCTEVYQSLCCAHFPRVRKWQVFIPIPFLTSCNNNNNSPLKTCNHCRSIIKDINLQHVFCCNSEVSITIQMTCEVFKNSRFLFLCVFIKCEVNILQLNVSGVNNWIFKYNVNFKAQCMFPSTELDSVVIIQLVKKSTFCLQIANKCLHDLNCL